MALTNEELKEKIKLILSQAERYAHIYADPAFDFDQRVRSFGAHTIPIAAPGEALVTNEQVFLLRMLYAHCGPELQERFPLLLLENLNENTAAIIVHTIFDIGHLPALAKAFREKRPTLTITTRLIVWYRVREKLATEAHRFTEQDLTDVDAMRIAELQRTPEPERREPPLSF
jgi:hypothetical protein